ncbi:iron-siderophore ABC transporter substrate-binding protein, partial [Streptomyces fulvissimus]|nr:iron-siderophore ABC transporter substrate-binding protein [Streptomyces microflavus]
MSSLFSQARRKAVAVSAAATALVVVLGGCSSSNEDKPSASAKSDGAFPVSIKSKLGTAEIPEEPKKVVTLGQGSAE